MLNKFFKKSISSKLFFMNLLILAFIISSQIIFQLVFFEKYYFNSKEKKLEKNINAFKVLLEEKPDKQRIMDFIQEVKNKENIALSFNSLHSNERIGIEPYMGNRQIIINDNRKSEKYKIILGDQFANININKNDYIQVYGVKDEYGYIFPRKVSINGIDIQKYYEIIPENNKAALSLTPANDINSPVQEIYVEGFAEELKKEDNSYNILSNADLYLNTGEKINIINNKSYTEKVESNNIVDDILFSSYHFENGVIMAVTTLSEVNEVIGNMNSYYIMIFFIALILVVVISFVYSRFMTKPLVEMSRVAKSISECDFNHKYNVSSEDEIGVLGSSLNLISENLEKSLNEVRDTNLKLKEEMKSQKVQEEKRKELIANISHELKTPITIIQGSINGIKSGMYTADMYEDILEETSKMNDLVKEMLEISKLESANFKLNEGLFDLCSIFLKEQDKLKSMIMDKNLNIKFEIDDEAIVFGDEKRINQVILNLLTNAIKYTPEGEDIYVVISSIQNGEQYKFSIKNYGISLSVDEQDKIWESFYRTEKSRNKRFGGTGLGLSIVKRILELHHSDYGVKSEENNVEFYFTLKSIYYDDDLRI